MENKIKKWTVNCNWYDYKYTMKFIEEFGSKWAQVICKWANLNQFFLLEDLDLVIKEIIPDLIKIEIEDNKNDYLRIRLTKANKNKIKKLAEKKKLSITDFITQEILS